MLVLNSRLTGLTLAAAMVLALASPGYAQRSEINGRRAAAIHECSVQSGKFIEHTWGDVEIQRYRACMAEHGERE